jgi:hypothetical protein
MLARLDLERLMKNIRIRMPGVLDDVILLELYNTFDSFLQGTNIWKENITFTAQYGAAVGDTVIIEPEVAGQIYQLLGVINSQGTQERMVMPNPPELVYVDIPSTTDQWTAQVAITCTDPVTRDGYPVVPDWILAKYRQVITDGTLSRIFSQPSKPYTSDKLAIFHARLFEAGKGKAKAEASQQNLYRGQAWRYPQAFATRRPGQR